jgi:uncharacterized protein with FMN-binding domain
MLSPGKKRENLAGKLLLSSALIAISLAYGWWQRSQTSGPILAAATVPQPNQLRPVPRDLPTIASASATPIPEADVAPSPKDVSGQTAVAPTPQKSFAVAKAAPQPDTPAVVSAPPQVSPPQNETSPSSPAPSVLTAQQAMQMNLPTDGPSPALALVTGTPGPGIGSPAPAGMHLADGDFVSDRQEMAWGDLRVKISIHGGLITGVQIMQYPDHRSQSLYLSQMAGPILESEVIKNQKAQVDTVSSATDTSYSFQDTVANAIMKATRE